jgi:hypothetical protein
MGNLFLSALNLVRELCYLYLGDPSVLRCTKIICPQLGTNVSVFEEDERFLFNWLQELSLFFSGSESSADALCLSRLACVACVIHHCILLIREIGSKRESSTCFAGMSMCSKCSYSLSMFYNRLLHLA